MYSHPDLNDPNLSSLELKKGTTNLASFALTAQCLIPGKNASTVSHPQQSVPSMAKTKGALIDNQRVPELLKCDATNLLALKKGTTDCDGSMARSLAYRDGSMALLLAYRDGSNGSLARISRRRNSDSISISISCQKFSQGYTEAQL